MKVVSNAGPLIALGKLGQLGLLLKLYDEILLPREVFIEVVVNIIPSQSGLCHNMRGFQPPPRRR